MPKRVQRPFCTIYKRSESEKRTWEATKAVEAQKLEIEELKKQIEELKGLVGSVPTKPEDTTEGVNESEDTKEEETPTTSKRKSKKTN